MSNSLKLVRRRMKLYFKARLYPLYKALFRKNIDTIFEKQVADGIENIPVFIVSYNRLSYLKHMVEELERLNIKNINIIDNASTYPPLLEYYKKLKYKIFGLFITMSG